MFTIRRLGSFIPLVLGLLILMVIALLAPWKQIIELLGEIPVQIFIALTALSAVYYASKTLRFWYILRLLDIQAPFPTVALLYLSGQPFSLLPAGELYRSILLKKYLGIRVSKSSPSVTIQGLVEAIVLIVISIAGAFMIGQNRKVVAIVGLLLLLLIIALQRGWLKHSYSLINRLPFLSVNKRKFQKFIDSHQTLMKPQPLLTLVALSLIPVFAGVGILYIASWALQVDITFIQSMIGYSLPVIISGLSFLPGGLGVSEGGTIGMVQLFGASTAAAVTIALLVRIFTLVAGLIYGLVAQIILHMKGNNI